MAADRRELRRLIKSLEQIFEEAGGRADDDKKGETSGDEFTTIKHRMAETIRDVKADLRTQSESRGLDRSSVELNQKIRAGMKKLTEDFKDLNRLYDKEVKKRKSKLSKEDLDLRQELIAQYSQEMQEIKKLARAGYMKDAGAADPTLAFSGAATSTLTREELFKPSGGGAGGGGAGGGGRRAVQDVELTEFQQQGLAQIKANDLEMDQMLDEIGVVVQDLGQMAGAIQEEVKVQGVMLDDLETKIEKAQDKLTSVNQAVKESLESKGLGGERACINMICCIVLLGIVGVLYNLLK